MASRDTYVESSAASFSSPDMDQGSFGILVQVRGGALSLGTPTWNGINMTLAVLNDGNPSTEGNIGIWYILPVPEGITTIVRGSNVTYCWAIKARGIQLFGDPVRGSAQTGGQGVGSLLMTGPSSMLTVDYVVSVASFDAGATSPAGVVAQFDSQSSGANDFYVGDISGFAGAQEIGWEHTGTDDGSAAAAVFKGSFHRAGTIVFG